MSETTQAVIPENETRHFLGRRAMMAVASAALIGMGISTLVEAPPAAAAVVGAHFKDCGQPEGDVTAVTAGEGVVVYGGNFSRWENPDGSEKPADKLAVVDERTCDLKFGGHDINGWIRAAAIRDNKIFIGGYFTEVAGQRRKHVAAIDMTGHLDSRWHPSVRGPVRGIAVAHGNVVVGGLSSAVEAFSDKNGKHEWSRKISGGSAMMVLANGQNVYIGGSFSHVGKVKKHSIAELNASSGKLIKSFGDTEFKHPGGVCKPAHHPQWAESCVPIVLSGALDNERGKDQKLVLGVGGIHNEVVFEQAKTGKREAMKYLPGDGQAIGNVTIATKVHNKLMHLYRTFVGYHRNTKKNPGNKKDYGEYAAEFNTRTGELVPDKTALRTLNGYVGGDADQGHGGIQAEWVIKRVKGDELIAGGAFGGPKRGAADIPMFN